MTTKYKDLKYKDRLFIVVHVVGLAPTKSGRTLDLQSRAFAAQPHMPAWSWVFGLRSLVRCERTGQH